ncbi:hypothetical protein TPENAI_10094 [Tenacibaculum litopenaei]|uniref:hypothetical protein n=1 Tax=Tenacibaculum litopenaei TaxID=396016 RepID=UPI00389575C0
MSTVNSQITDAATQELAAANKLMHDVSTTEGNTAKLEADTKSLYNDLETIDNDLAVSKKINTALSDIDSALGEAIDLLEVVSVIPEIGAEAAELKDTLSAFKKPIDEALSASNDVEKVVSPVRNAIEKIAPKVQQVDKALLNLMNRENSLIAALGNAIQCIDSLPSSSVKTSLGNGLDAAAEKVDPIVLDFDAVQIQLLNGINSAEAEAQKLVGMVSGLVSLQNQINAIMNVLNPLISELNEVKKVLSDTIRVPYGGYPKVCYKHVLGVKVPYPCGWHTVYFSFSVDDILKGVDVIKPVMDLLNKAMEKVLDPVLKALHLNINLPSIPGLGVLNDLTSALNSFENSIEAPINALAADLSKIESVYAQLETYEQELDKIYQSCSVELKS